MVPQAHRRAPAGQRQAHRLGLLGRELQLAAPAVYLLCVDARLVAVVDAGEHDPRPFVVEQRDRHRLLAGELVVGVVAHQRAVRDRSPQRQLGPGEPPVQARGDILDVLVQPLERLLHRGGVGHQVALTLLAEDQPLGAAQAAHPERPARGTPAAPRPPRRRRRSR